MENKTKNKVSESVRFLQISLVCYWLSVVLLVDTDYYTIL